MKHKIFFSQVLISGIIGLLVAIPFISRVEAATAKAGVSTTTESVVKSEIATDDSSTAEVKEKTTGVWNSVKAWGISIYNVVDAWRTKQLGVWVAIKAEKKEQLDAAQGKMESDRDARVEGVLEGEELSLYNGAGEELEGTGNVFLLKLYSFVLGIFIIIFKSPIIFYAITIFLIVVILSKIVDSIRGPRRI